MKQYLALLIPSSSPQGPGGAVGLDELTVSTTRVAAGSYDLSSDSFTNGQTFAFASSPSKDNKVKINFPEEGLVTVRVYDANGNLVDAGINIAIHIIVTE